MHQEPHSIMIFGGAVNDASCAVEIIVSTYCSTHSLTLKPVSAEYGRRLK